MQYKDPFRGLTRGLPEAVEQTPEFRAMRAGHYSVETTWGNLASQLVEADLVDPTTEAICDFLVISADELADPEPIFGRRWGANYYWDRVERAIDEDYRKRQGQSAATHATSLQTQFDTHRTDDGSERADGIQAQINTLAAQESAAQTDREAWVELRKKIDLLCLRRDALTDGYDLPLTTFLEIVFYHREDGFFTYQEIATATRDMLENLAREYYLPLEEGETLARDILLGEDQLKDFHRALRHVFENRIRTLFKARQASILPFILSQNPEDHVLLSDHRSKAKV